MATTTPVVDKIAWSWNTYYLCNSKVGGNSSR